MISDDATEADKAEFDRAISLIQSTFSNQTVTGDPALVREVMDLATNNADIVVRFVDEIEGHEGAFGAAVNYYTLGEGESAQEFSESQALNLTDDERSNLQYSRTEVHMARDRGSISPDRLPGIQRFVNDPAQVLASTILHEFFHGVAPWIYWNFWDVQIEDASTPYPNGQEEQDARSRQNSLHNILLNE